MSQPTLPDDLNPVVVAALAKLIGSITGLVPPPANCFPPEWHEALRDFYRTASEIAMANLASKAAPVAVASQADAFSDERVNRAIEAWFDDHGFDHDFARRMRNALRAAQSASGSNTC